MELVFLSSGPRIVRISLTHVLIADPSLASPTWTEIYGDPTNSWVFATSVSAMFRHNSGVAIAFFVGSQTNNTDNSVSRRRTQPDGASERDEGLLSHTLIVQRGVHLPVLRRRPRGLRASSGRSRQGPPEPGRSPGPGHLVSGVSLTHQLRPGVLQESLHFISVSSITSTNSPITKVQWFVVIIAEL